MKCEHIEKVKILQPNGPALVMCTECNQILKIVKS